MHVEGADQVVVGIDDEQGVDAQAFHHFHGLGGGLVVALAVDVAHLGAGAVTSNVKSDKSLVSVKAGDTVIETGRKNFGAIVGDEVEVFGPRNPVETMAAQAGTIPYELTCAVSKRVPRVYLQNGQVTERELLLRF